MADEMTQEQTVESIPAAQESSIAAQGETQQVQADTTAPVTEKQPETASEPIQQEIEDWNGNDVDTLPKPLQARARGMLRHLHKVSQEAAAVKQHAQAYQEIVNHPEFQEFLQFKEQRQNNPTLPEFSQTQEPLSEDEFLAAQTDPSKFAEVHNKLLMQKAAPVLKELQQLRQELSQFKQEKVREQAARQLDLFTKDHADFWEINPVVMKGALEEIVQKKGGTIQQAYDYAKSIEKQYLEKANGTIKQQVEAKKKAVTASPSKSMEPEIIYAPNKAEANRIAFENAKLGKQVDVRVKR